jgi:hypothetical protein
VLSHDWRNSSRVSNGLPDGFQANPLSMQRSGQRGRGPLRVAPFLMRLLARLEVILEMQQPKLRVGLGSEVDQQGEWYRRPRLRVFGHEPKLRNWRERINCCKDMSPVVIK